VGLGIFLLYLFLSHCDLHHQLSIVVGVVWLQFVVGLLLPLPSHLRKCQTHTNFYIFHPVRCIELEPVIVSLIGQVLYACLRA
jgi:hypothetical protein